MESPELLALLSDATGPSLVTDLVAHLLLLCGDSADIDDALTTVLIPDDRRAAVAAIAAKILIRRGEMGLSTARDLLFHGSRNIRSRIAAAFFGYPKPTSYEVLIQLLVREEVAEPIYSGVTGYTLLRWQGFRRSEVVQDAIRLMESGTVCGVRHGAYILLKAVDSFDDPGARPYRDDLPKEIWGEIAAVQDFLYELYCSPLGDDTLLHLLARAGDRRALEPLLRLLEESESIVDIYNSLISLGFVGDVSTSESILPLLCSKESLLRIGAANALGRMGLASGIPTLQDALQENRKQISLCQDQESQDGASDEDGYKLTEYIAFHFEASTALVRLQCDSAKAEILRYFYFDDSYNGVSALPGLRLLGQSVVPELIAILETEGREDVLSAACRALADIGHAPGAIPFLTRLLCYSSGDEYRNASVRTAAADALQVLGDFSVVLPLVDLLSDNNREIAIAACRVLAKYADSRIAPALAKFLAGSSTYGYVYYDALAALIACGREAAYEAVKDLLLVVTAESERIALVFALAWINDKRALTLLCESASIATELDSLTAHRVAIAYLERAPDEWIGPLWE